MSQMQIDGRSPTPLSSAGHKRPRSPASPSPQDRPFKRVASAPSSVGRTPSPLLGHAIRQQQVPPAHLHLQPPSQFRERRASEDWVAKTSGLKLDSPLFDAGQVSSMPSPESGQWGCTGSAEVGCVEDELMNTDVDDATLMVRGSGPFPSTIGHDASQQAHVPEPAPLPLYNTTRQSTPIHRTTTPVAQSDIRINVLTATPPHHEPRRSSFPQPSPMSPSSSNMGTWKPPSPSHRKPRITMGPRPDCEKCRSGMKGHWMHID